MPHPRSPTGLSHGWSGAAGAYRTWCVLWLASHWLILPYLPFPLHRLAGPLPHPRPSTQPSLTANDSTHKAGKGAEQAAALHSQGEGGRVPSGAPQRAPPPLSCSTTPCHSAPLLTVKTPLLAAEVWLNLAA